MGTNRKSVFPFALLSLGIVAMLGQSCGGSKSSISDSSADGTTLRDTNTAPADVSDKPVDAPVTKADGGDARLIDGSADRSSDAPIDAPIIEPPPPGSAPILVGAGDIGACDRKGAGLTAKILDAIFPNGGGPSIGYVITLGDNAYKDGTSANYAECYDPHWGRHKTWTKPAAGNHEYHLPETNNPPFFYPYFDNKFGSPDKGAYYSYDIGTWHVVVLDNYAKVGMNGSSQQIAWLRSDLAANAGKKCTLAYFHRGLFSSGPHGSADPKNGPGVAWRIFQEFKLDVVVAAHDHLYERFAPMNVDGTLDTTNGIRQFIVGTGGGGLYDFENYDVSNLDANPGSRNSEVRYNDGWGVIKLTLHPDRYDWEFISEPGKPFTDKGTEMCR